MSNYIQLRTQFPLIFTVLRERKQFFFYASGHVKHQFLYIINLVNRNNQMKKSRKIFTMTAENTNKTEKEGLKCRNK